jgi:hypothetical protein
MPNLVTAKDGDTLCTIAIAHGFLDCGPLRKEKNNEMYLNRPLRAGECVTVPEAKVSVLAKAADAMHKFFKKSAPPVSIRFVRGTADEKNYMHDSPLTELQVSNHIPTKSGADGSRAFPAGFGFNADADADVDAFRVEVVDPAAGGSLRAKLEALRPVYDAKGAVKSYRTFEGTANAGMRKIDSLECKALGAAPKAFRSAYLRLVTDKEDREAAAAQTILVTDCVDDGDEAVEILDQKIRATYEIPRCPGTGGKKCSVIAELPVGKDRWRVRVSIHILKDPATGTAVAGTDATRKQVLKAVRQRYAQANLGVKILNIREVPAPANLFAIANPQGKLAVGGGTITVKVKIDATEKTISIVSVHNDTPEATATKLADAINACFAAAEPPLEANARVVPNPPREGEAIASADVLVGNPLNSAIVLSVTASADLNHPVEVGRMNNANLDMAPWSMIHYGTLKNRVLVKNYDTGADRIDVFVVANMSEAYGLGIPPLAHRAADLQPKENYQNTAFLRQTSVTTDSLPFVFPHEFGHILMDAYHAASPSTELMFAGGQANSQSRGMDGRRRISDPIKPREIDMGCKTGNPVEFLRSANATGAIEQSW